MLDFLSNSQTKGPTYGVATLTKELRIRCHSIQTGKPLDYMYTQVPSFDTFYNTIKRIEVQRKITKKYPSISNRSDVYIVVWILAKITLV